MIDLAVVGKKTKESTHVITVGLNHNDIILQSISIGEAVFATGGGNLWEAEFLADTGASTPKMLSVAASNATSFAKRESDSEIVLSWRGIPLGGEADALDATVIVAKNADGSQTWSLRFANRSPRCKLQRTCFPMLRRVTRDGEGDALLPWKDYGARLFRKRKAQPRKVFAHYLGYAPPVAAFFLGDTGLYFAAEDPEARQKCLVEGGEQNVHFDTCVELGADGPGYNVTLAPLKGDWWEAARRYRKFALRQKWARLGPIKDNPSYHPGRCAKVTIDGIDVEGSTVEVYTLGGVKIYSGAKDAVTVPSSGVYIVKTGSKAIKVMF